MLLLLSSLLFASVHVKAATVSCPAPQLTLIGNDPYNTQPCSVFVEPLVYKINGKTVDTSAAGEELCKSSGFGDTCLQKYELGWDTNDEITVTFSYSKPMTGVKLAARLCYTPAFSIDRAWRKPKAVVAKDKHCPFKFGDSTTSPNTLTLKLPSDIPKAVYYVTVIAQNSTTLKPIGRGYSQQYVQIRVMDGTTPGMIAGVAVLSTLSIVILIVFFIQDYIRNGAKKGN